MMMKKSSFIELDGKEKRRLIQFLDIKVTMENRTGPQNTIDQLLEKVDISKCMNEGYDSIMFQKMLDILRLEYNICIENRQLYYYSTDAQMFINCGLNPLCDEVKIDLKEIDLNIYLHIKIRELQIMNIARLMVSQGIVNTVQQVNSESEDLSDNNINNKSKKKCRRTKERRIGHIIEKVIEWRKFYTGTSDQSRQHQKYSLEEAAKKVRISKKSLDDYLFQIRFGYRFNFNFNEHYNEKVGILRDFVRQQKKSTKTDQKQRKRKMKEQERE